MASCHDSGVGGAQSPGDHLQLAVTIFLAEGGFGFGDRGGRIPSEEIGDVR